jgi:hypothetical protein
MTDQVSCVNDRRGFLFTINLESNPVYQVESHAWARPENRWNEEDIPKAIRDKMAQLEQSGKPGAFVRFMQGETGVYLVCEKNINNLPACADDEISFEPPQEGINGPTLAPYDIVVRTKGGMIQLQNGEAVETPEGAYYVIPCQSWTRFVLEQSLRPGHVETTKEFLLLLDDLHGQNFLAMSPDKPTEVLPPDLSEPVPAIIPITCYVLNLAHFQR